MIAQLRAKPGADDIGVTIGDFATTTVGRTFTLAYLVRNIIENPTTQDEQVERFRNVATHLEPGGCFVIEVEVPALQRLPPGETIRAFTVTPHISASTSTTSPRKAWSLTTTGCRTASSKSFRHRSAKYRRPNST